jgi:hypothetical protein
VKTGVQGVYKLLKLLDSGFHRNDEKLHFQSFCEFIRFDRFVKGLEIRFSVIPVETGIQFFKRFANSGFPPARE